MNRGLKHYTKQLTQEVGGASCSVNLNKEDANLHISIPLIKTVGLDPIDLSLIFNLQDYLDMSLPVSFFGRGSKLNLYKRIIEQGSYIDFVNSDGSTDRYPANNNYINVENNMKVIRKTDSNSTQYYSLEDKIGNVSEYYTSQPYPRYIRTKDGRIYTFSFDSIYPTIDNGKGDNVTFITGSDGNISRINYTHNNELVYYVELGYLNQTLSSVRYINGTTLMASLTISISSIAVEIIDNISGHRNKYNLSSNRVTSFVDGFDWSYSNGRTTSVTYNTNQTIVTNFLGEKCHIYFDKKQLPRFEIDGMGNIVETEYDENTKRLLSKTDLSNVKDSSGDILGGNTLATFAYTGALVRQEVSLNDEFLGNLLGKAYKFSSTGSGTKTISFSKQFMGIAGDQLSLFLFGRQLTKFTDSTYVKVTLKVDNQEVATRYFTKTTLDNLFDCITIGYSAKKSFSSVAIIITIEGSTSIELAGLQFRTKKLGSFYNYDEQGNLVDMNFGMTSVNTEYNASNYPNKNIGQDSAMSDFEYDDNGNLTKYKAAYDAKVENTYHPTCKNKITESKISNAQGNKILQTKKEYTSDGRFVSSIEDELGNKVSYSNYDKFGRPQKITDQLDKVMEVTYFDDGQLKTISFETQDTSSYTYDTKKRIKTISCPNGSVYQFEYDDYDNLEEVKLNNVVMYRYTYDPQTGRLLTQKNGQSGDGYEFVYDSSDSTLLKEIYYLDSNNIRSQGPVYMFGYDTKKRLTYATLCEDVNLYQYHYDKEGQISAVELEYGEINRKYDNLGNVVLKESNINNKKVYTSYDTVSRSKGSHPNSMFKGVLGFIGTFDNDNKIRDKFGLDGSEPEEISPVIYSTSTYSTATINKEGIIGCIDVNASKLLSYQLTEPRNSFSEKGSIQFWFKPNDTGPVSGKKECIFSVRNTSTMTSEQGYIEIILDGGKLKLYVVDDNGVNRHLITSTYSINYGEWNFVSLNFSNNNAGPLRGEITEYMMILNNHTQRYIDQNCSFTMNLGNNPIYNIGRGHGGGNGRDHFDGKIAALRISHRNYYTYDQIYRYYQLSKDYIVDNELVDEDTRTVDFSQTTLFTTNTNIQNLFNIYPLQNSVESLSNLKPKKFEIRKVSDSDKDRTFNFNNKIKRYAYVADGSELVYDLGNSNEGTIALRVYFDGTTSTQYVFEGKDSLGNKLGLFRNSSGSICVDVNGQEIDTGLVVVSRKWSTIALSFGETIVSDSDTETNTLDLRVVVDEDAEYYTVYKTFEYGSLDISIGRKHDYTLDTYYMSNFKNYYPLYGQIEMLAMCSSFCEESTIYTLFNELKEVTQLHAFDELGMLKYTDLHKAGSSIMSHTYNYQAKEGNSNYISKLVNQELFKTNGIGLTNRTYTYDKMGRVIRIDDNEFGSHTYEYNARGFLIKADNVNYTYDSNGNITSVGDSKIFKYNPNNNREILRQIEYKVGITTIQKNIDYDTNNPGMIKSFDGNNFTFEGKRLKKITNSNGTYEFIYDHLGNRIEKYGFGNSIIYQYDGNKLICQFDNSLKLDFLYDENDQLYGFIRNSVDKYYYVRDTLQNILGIIDSNGNIVVKYDYDPYGTIKSITGTLASTIGKENPFRYKGYYYDEETQLYWVSSRYYSPELCRWISPDSIEYLDPESINGLNLYAYCNNDPVNKYDPTGHFPWLILAAVLLFTPVGGTALQVATSALSYAGMAVASIFDEDIRNDMNTIGWNPFNTDESATLNSSKVSFYKGVPVFRTAAGGRSGSFGAIFLTKGSGVDTLRHERGHNWQLMMMGIANYGLMIGLPSWREWSNRLYYERPWEITADVFGGVTGRTHSQADINRGYWYLGVSSLLGPLGYFFLLGEY